MFKKQYRSFFWMPPLKFNFVLFDDNPVSNYTMRYLTPWMPRFSNTTPKAPSAMQPADPNTSPWTQPEDNLVYQLVRRMGMKCTTISKALGDRTPLQLKDRWYSVLRKWELSVFDDIDMMMRLRSRVRKSESITALILD
jgi:hypothetical protein